MKYYRKVMWIMIGLMVLIQVLVNWYLLSDRNKDTGREYMVEISRLAAKMELEDISENEVDLSDCIYVKRISACHLNEELAASSRYDYAIKIIGNSLYRFEYEVPKTLDVFLVIMINSILALSFLFVVSVFVYFKRQIIEPFSKMQQMPYELAKGNLTIDLEESKSRYFGKYIWGTNMLRESIEDQRKKELQMHREKKMLLLSLTHDIKTPLSVIKLNAQALSRGLYVDADKQKETAEHIVGKVDEIEGYVTKMIEASREDFLQFEVKEEDFYLSSVMDEVVNHYQRKLELHKTKFQIDSYSDCLLKGDHDRLVEVIQNLMENAIKYGDGELIHISVGREEDCRLISVSNTGIGMKKEELPHLFDSFYRGTNVGNEPGSGLGLYICRKLMNQMNGDVFVNQNEGNFTVTVVVREA